MLNNSRILYHTYRISSLLQLKDESLSAIFKIVFTKTLNMLPPMLAGSAVIASDTVKIALQRYAAQMTTSSAISSLMTTLMTTPSSTTTLTTPSSTTTMNTSVTETPQEIIVGQLILAISTMLLVALIIQAPVKALLAPIYDRLFGLPAPEEHDPAEEQLIRTLLLESAPHNPVIATGYNNPNLYPCTIKGILRPQSIFREGVTWKEVFVAALIRSFELTYLGAAAVIANYYDPTSTLNNQNPDQSIEVYDGANFYYSNFGLIFLTMCLAIIPYQIAKMVASKTDQFARCCSGKGAFLGSDAPSGNGGSMKYTSSPSRFYNKTLNDGGEVQGVQQTSTNSTGHSVVPINSDSSSSLGL